MTDIGAKLLALLTDAPGEWEYRPVHDGLRHEPTGIIVTTTLSDRVCVMADSLVCSDALSDDDHAALYAVASDMVARLKGESARRPREVLCGLLGIKPEQE